MQKSRLKKPIKQIFRNIFVHRRISRWRQQNHLPYYERIFYHLYANVNGFEASREARAGQDAMEFVYGEIEFEPFVALLSLCQPQADTVFMDLGSGIGKAVLVCALVFDVKACIGIEYFSKLHACAQEIQSNLSKMPEYQTNADKIQFINSDFLSCSFEQVNLIFINATSFFGDHWKKISRHLESLKTGARVITTSKSLDSKHFIILHLTRVQMSWGIVKVWIQERIE